MNDRDRTEYFEHKKKKKYKKVYQKRRKVRGHRKYEPEEDKK